MSVFEKPQTSACGTTPIDCPASSSAVTFGDLLGREPHVGRSRRRRGDSQATDLMHQFHVALGPVEPFRPPRVVVHDPFGKTNRAHDCHPEVLDAFTQILKGPAAAGMGVEFVDPGLERLITGLSRQFDDFSERKLLSAKRAGVQADMKSPRRR